jgi:hypothetical protein
VLVLRFRKINIKVRMCRFELNSLDYMRHTHDKLGIMTFRNLNVFRIVAHMRKCDHSGLFAGRGIDNTCLNVSILVCLRDVA